MKDRHGCYNRKPFSEEYVAQSGWKADGGRKEVLVPFRMSRACMHPEKKDDPRCVGCKWINVEEENA